MKGYYGESTFRIVGKAWEVRYKLRTLTKQMPQHVTLSDWLKSHPDRKFRLHIKQ